LLQAIGEDAKAAEYLEKGLANIHEGSGRASLNRLKDLKNLKGFKDREVLEDKEVLEDEDFLKYKE
jgi:hypothetical protein